MQKCIYRAEYCLNALNNKIGRNIKDALNDFCLSKSCSFFDNGASEINCATVLVLEITASKYPEIFDGFGAGHNEFHSLGI